MEDNVVNDIDTYNFESANNSTVAALLGRTGIQELAQACGIHRSDVTIATAEKIHFYQGRCKAMHAGLRFLPKNQLEIAVVESYEEIMQSTPTAFQDISTWLHSSVKLFATKRGIRL